MAIKEKRDPELLTKQISVQDRIVSFPIKECEVVPLLLSDNDFVRNFGGRERACSFIDIFEKCYGGLDRLVAAFHEGKDSSTLWGNRTVISLLRDLEHNSDANKGLDIRYDDLVSLYIRISECCGVKDNAHFALPQRISFEGKQFIMPGYGVIDFHKAVEINGRPVFFGRDNRLKLESVFSYQGKLLEDSTPYEPFSVLECGDVRFLCKTVVTDWDYMLSNELLKNYDGKILLRAKHFHWDTGKGCLSVHTLAGNVKTMSSEELKGLLKPGKDLVKQVRNGLPSL